MKQKELLANFYPDEGRSVYSFSVGNKIYIGEAFCREEDEPSSFFGISLARTRAYLDYTKDIINDLKMQRKGLINFRTTLEQTKGFNPDARHVKQLNKNIHYLDGKIAENRMKIRSLKQYLEKAPSERAKMIEKIKRKKMKKI